MKNIRAYKSISEWQKDLEAEGYSVSAGVCESIEQAMKTQGISFANAYMLLVEQGFIIPAAVGKQNRYIQLHSLNARGVKRAEIRAALNKLEVAKKVIFGQKIRMDIKEDIHAFFSAMDYFYKTFPYGKGADVEFLDEMEKFDAFVVYARKLTDRIRHYESTHKPNKIIVHKYKFPDLKD